MHELSVAANILETALDNAKDLRRIKEIHLSVGCLMMLNLEQLAFGLELLARGTIAENAKLYIKTKEAKLKCENGHETIIEIKEVSMEHLLPVVRCSVCNGPTEILEGRELILTRIVGE